MSKIIKEYRAKQMMEGAGVLVNRVFGHSETKHFDPFLMLDYLESPKENLDSPGFPWHPHKGMETITYMIKGSGQHEDSLGNKGIIGPGELQWMSAAKGILHQEMPAHSPKGSKMLQFWVNLPASKKLNDPSYEYIRKGEMKSIEEDGVKVNVIAGEYNDLIGPIDKSDQGITMLHVILSPGSQTHLKRSKEKQGFIFVITGKGLANNENINALTAYTLLPGIITISADDNEEVELIFAEGRPIKEPIAWQGPIVMNTQKELLKTFKDLNNGTFV